MRSTTGLALVLLATACGGSSGSGRPSAPPAIDVNGKAASQAQLVAQQFLNPSGFIATLTLVPPSQSRVSWSVDSNTYVALGNSDPKFLSGSPTPPPGGTFVYLKGPPYGKSVVTASTNGMRVSIPVLTYASLALRCEFRYQAAYSFDPGSTPQGLQSDLYATEASDSNDPLDPCSQTVFVTGVSAVHFPYGGIVVAGNLATFASIAGSQWNNAATQLPESAIVGGVLLFKTKGGRIVKTMLPTGPFEVSGTDGTFPY